MKDAYMHVHMMNVGTIHVLMHISMIIDHDTYDQSVLAPEVIQSILGI